MNLKRLGRTRKHRLTDVGSAGANAGVTKRVVPSHEVIHSDAEFPQVKVVVRTPKKVFRIGDSVDYRSSGLDAISDDKLEALAESNPKFKVYWQMHKRGSDFEIPSAEAPHIGLGGLKSRGVASSGSVKRAGRRYTKS